MSLPEVFFLFVMSVFTELLITLIPVFTLSYRTKTRFFFIVKIHHRTINKKNRNMRGWWWACAHLAENKKKHFHIRERGSWTYEHNANSTSYMYMNEDELWLTPLRIEWNMKINIYGSHFWEEDEDGRWWIYRIYATNTPDRSEYILIILSSESQVWD